MKRIITLVLAVLMVMPLMCGFALAEEAPVKLTMSVKSNPSIPDYNTNDFSKWLEETANVDLEFIVIPADVANEKVNMMLNTGDYPDIWMNAVPNEYMYGVEEGVLLDYTPYLNDEYLPNLCAELEKHPHMVTGGKAIDGGWYTFPSFNISLHTRYYNKVWYNTMWLEKLGCDIPTDAQEFYDVMVKYKELNPDGIAFTGEVPQVIGFVVNMFTYYPNSDYGLRVVDGTTVETMVDDEEYREALRYLNKLYSEGLLYEATFNMDDSQRKALFTSEGEPVLFMGMRHNVRFMDGISTPELYAHTRALTPLVGPDGETQYTTYFPANIGGNAAISTTCENIEAALHVIDLFYSGEGALRNKFGTPGIHWDYAEEGAIGLYGDQAYYVEKVPYSNEPSDRSWVTGGIYYAPKWLIMEVDPNGDLNDPANGEVLRAKVTVEQYEPYYQEEYQTLPTLKYTSTESEEMSFIGTSLKSYIEQSRVEFIIGTKDLDKDWDAYVESLNNMGMNEYIEYVQTAWDRSNG